MARGIDYSLGTANRDPTTGIHFGVIHANDVGMFWYEDSTADYGPPSCPECGEEVHEYRPGVGDFRYEEPPLPYHCESCGYAFDSDEAFGEDPVAYYLDDGEYRAEQHGGDCDIFVMKSPYYTRATFCGPCAPGAGYLSSPCEDGVRAYCFGHEWFEDGVAPYPVYLVVDDTPISQEKP